MFKGTGQTINHQGSIIQSILKSFSILKYKQLFSNFVEEMVREAEGKAPGMPQLLSFYFSVEL